MVVLASLVCSPPAGAAPSPEAGSLVLDAVPGARLLFGGAMGERIRANEENWLLRAPDANPGILEMFRERDRRPVPQLVPWAGEFIGKYLLGAIPACRMTANARLRDYIGRVVRELIATQAEDGYLGPFRKEERLLGHWDLWGHYHVILALLLWHQETGDPDALACAVRAADLICRTYLDGPRRMREAGSTEMNLAIIHALGRLYRITGNERYLRMMREIEKDWESEGDYFRTGLAGVPFYRIPKPRWESLHNLQGLVELYRITGDERYRRAFLSHWQTIRQHDRHPTGGFSTGEQAIGNPYSRGAIETCCTIAWMAITVDALRLTGDPQVADELELSTWNGMLGAQHPSGRWWTYDTPLDGARLASAHSIVFQARQGTPELNCCAANAPRGLAMLADWAVMRDRDGLTINYYGPCRISASLADGTPVELIQETRYPDDGTVRLQLAMKRQARFNLRLRIPAWSRHTEVLLNGEPVSAGKRAASRHGGIVPGTYLAIERRWRQGDSLEIRLDMSLHYWAGEKARAGHAALYTGPVLLAFDPHFNAMDPDAIPTLDLERLALRPVPLKRSEPLPPGRFVPIVARETTAADGQQVTLCDFATAGAHGSTYVSWLPVTHAAPPPVWQTRPAPGQPVAAGPVIFAWTAYQEIPGRTFTLTVARDPEMRQVVARADRLTTSPYLLRTPLEPGATYYWAVTASNAYGTAADVRGPQPFLVDASLPNTSEEEMALYRRGERGLIAASALDGNGTPSFGVLESETGIRPAPDRFGREGGAVAFGGQGAIKYRLASFPGRDYTFTAWVCPEGLPTNRLHQVFSAWATGGDDPLRVVFEGDSLFARIEGMGFHSTQGVPAKNGEWIHVGVVKQGPQLRLYVNGELRQTASVPEEVFSSAADFALGANPHYGGNECFVGRMDDFAFYAEAFTSEEIAQVFRKGQG